MFKKQPSENQLIFITFILVVLMGIPTFQTLTEKDSVSELTTPISAVASERSPASIPKARASTVSRAISHFTKYDLSCAKKAAAVATVAGGFVQFQGKNCLKNFKDGDVEIINKSNGFTASIFSSGSDKYQTDLIQLQQGENEITIRYRQSSGKPVEEVIRVNAASI